MEEIVNLIGADESASDISNQIKNILYTKAAERIDTIRPTVADAVFGNDVEETEEE